MDIEDVEADADGEAIERGRVLFAQSCTFVAAAARLVDLPAPGLPEVAFAGRSNVGKSSLLNALTGRRALARVSNTPGRTQTINLFDLGGRLVLADLPGYGYAAAPKSRVRGWGRMIDDYLAGRPTLRRALVLIDARHGLKPNDHACMTLLDGAAVAFQVVLTKVDKVAPGARADAVAGVAAALREHTAAHPRVIATSAAADIGIADLRAELATLAGAA